MLGSRMAVQTHRRTSDWLGALVLTPLLVFSALLVFVGTQRFVESKVAPNWPMAPAEVISVDVSHTRYAYTPSIKYKYSIGGKPYTSEFTFLDWPSMSKAEAQRVIDQYRSGSLVFTHYNPSNPARSAIYPTSEDHGVFLIGLGGFLFLFSLTSMLWLFRSAGISGKTQTQ
jgi:hypothetical protein